MVSLFTRSSEDEPGAWDTPTDKLLAALFFLLLGAVVSGWYVLENPWLDNQLYTLAHGEPNYSGGELVFTESQREAVNKVYSEVDDEYGWCLRVEDEKVVAVDHFASLEYTTERNISFSCYSDRYNSIMHTHPGGSTELSDVDVETLKETEWIRVSCVVAGVLPSQFERNPPDMACYRYNESSRVSQVETRFIERGEDS